MKASPDGLDCSIPADRTAWTVPSVARHRVDRSHDEVFVRDEDGVEETYAAFWARSQRLAVRLQGLGVQHGDRVVIQAQSGIPALHVWMALGLIGAVDVSVNTAYRGEPLRHVISMADPVAIVVDADLLPALDGIDPAVPALRHVIAIARTDEGPDTGWLAALEWHRYESLVAPPEKAGDEISELPDVHPSDIASVIFTSGTTGPAKGVMMPHAQVCLLALQTIEAMRLQAADVFYCIHPLYHIAGKFMGVFAIFAVGGTLCIDRKFNAGAWLGRIRQTGATASILHGPMIEMVHAQPARKDDRRHRMTRLMCCPLPKRIGGRFRERFGFTTIEMWGMSEVACPCWTSLQSAYVPGSCGKVLTDWYDFAIVDPETDEPLPPDTVGEIVVRPKAPWTIMQGYLGMPEATARSWRNLWFHTGDAASRDRDGNVFFLDRLGDRIRRRAENLSSYDIEAAATEHPQVRECAAFGVPSGYEGDDDVMVCVVTEPDKTLDPLSLFAFLAGQLPHFMVPRFVDVVPDLPRTPTNKVRKKMLRERGVTEQTWDAKSVGASVRDYADRS